MGVEAVRTRLSATVSELQIYAPLEVDLYFELFLNLNWKTLPVFDIDWSWQTRDKILEYILKNTAETNFHEDISMTQRQPYPQEDEIGLPRNKFSVQS